MNNEAGVKEGETFPETNSYQSNKSEVEKKAAEVHAAHKASLKRPGGGQLFNIFRQFLYH